MESPQAMLARELIQSAFHGRIGLIAPAAQVALAGRAGESEGGNSGILVYGEQDLPACSEGVHALILN